jgi:hypothetical protein
MSRSSARLLGVENMQWKPLIQDGYSVCAAPRLGLPTDVITHTTRTRFSIRRNGSPVRVNHLLSSQRDIPFIPLVEGFFARRKELIWRVLSFCP